MIWNAWWIWAAAGVGLGILEVLVPGWIFLGFALGAGTTSLLLAVGGPLGMAMEGSIAILLVTFAIASLIWWIVLRKVFGLRGGNVKTFDHDINE